VVLLLETDEAWTNAIKALETDYPHQLLQPMPNTYGLAFYSKLKIAEGGVRFMVEKDIPSVDAILELRSGKRIHVWGLHPKPPVPNESIRSDGQDKELMQVALKAKKEKLPVLVFGDLNDVAWSHITLLFVKVSGLLDPRRGRGFYNTFSANHWLMRFPLDYLFCSKHFGLVQMKRPDHNGSDHFPIFIHLTLNTTEKNDRQLHADKSDVKEAKEIAS
jgi:endonuclease/exonuclease/phosphatase (EEP) superfamily protein YafD